MNDKPVIKSYSKRELIDMYGTTYTTFYTWIKRAGIIDEFKNYDNIRVFTPKEVELIFDKLGEPNN